MSRVSGTAERVRVMVLRGEIGLGEPIVDERLRERLGIGRVTLRRRRRRRERPRSARARRDLGPAGPRLRPPDRRRAARERAPRPLLDAIVAGDEAEAADAARRHVLVSVPGPGR
jgi:DNA-binding GntR family transcriptional regulator